ncbi:MAG TPA: prepilin-type N-terminal cleavage/methylation domain-containing protein [Thermoanaerobaculia bacterium]|nr:prepilin-type N-terminal cleavage/methylation domain-containing protein [Thermoanaerobaculia bacterium]
MRNDRRDPASIRQSGYSLSELLVVVAIIGLMSVVAVPSFISMMNSSRLKSSLRKLTSDLRGARQQAVTQYRWVKVQLEPGVTPARYTIQQSADLGATWGDPVEKELIDPISIASTTFLDSADDADSFPEIIFRNNGTIAMGAGVESREIVIKTTANISKPQITITAKPTGKITAE